MVRVLGDFLGALPRVQLARAALRCGSPSRALLILEQLADTQCAPTAEHFTNRSDAALRRLEVDAAGLDAMDRRYLGCLAENYAGGPVGVETLAAVLAEQRDMLEEVIEPYLLQTGLLMRTPRGRCLSSAGWSYLDMTPPPGATRQLDMLTDTDDDDGS